MKKIVLTLAIAISSLVAISAEVNNVTKEVLHAFNTEFATATSVEWSENDNFYKASFQFNDQYVNALYTPEGHLIGVTRNISSLDLPVKLQAKIKKEYAGFWITNLFEVSNNGGTSYFLTVENAEAKLVLKSTDHNKWMPLKQTIKEEIAD